MKILLVFAVFVLTTQAHYFGWATKDDNAVETVEKPTTTAPRPSNLGCFLCTQLLSVTKHRVGLSQNQLRSALYEKCRMLPIVFKDQCFTFVETSLPEIYFSLNYDFSTKDICVRLNLCDEANPFAVGGTIPEPIEELPARSTERPDLSSEFERTERPTDLVRPERPAEVARPTEERPDVDGVRPQPDGSNFGFERIDHERSENDRSVFGSSFAGLGSIGDRPGETDRPERPDRPERRPLDRIGSRNLELELPEKPLIPLSDKRMTCSFCERMLENAKNYAVTTKGDITEFANTACASLPKGRTSDQCYQMADKKISDLAKFVDQQVVEALWCAELNQC